MTDKTNTTHKLTPTAEAALDLLGFIQRSPTPFHAVSNCVEMLESAGYVSQMLGEGIETGKFYFTRNDSSLIAVSINAPLDQGFHIVGAHTDSPCLKVKPNACYENNTYQQLGVEVYGGALLGPWFDRDLSMAGRVTVTDQNGRTSSRLIDFQRAIATIPSLAIHLNRDVNDENKINRQTHLPPVLALLENTLDFDALLLDQLKKQYPEQVFGAVLAHEISLYDTQPPAIIGLEAQLIASARLDNLLSSYLGLRALLDHKAQSNCIVVLSDHEEVGSATASGAAGPFLESVLRLICGEEHAYRRAICESLLISADNAHAVHPNYSDRHEPRHQPKINQGPVIKVNHNQRYASNSETQGLFALLCHKSGVPYQTFVVRSDMGCGSTIGPIIATELGVRTIDIGVPQLAMHSIREMAGVDDCAYLLAALTAFFNEVPGYL